MELSLTFFRIKLGEQFGDVDETRAVGTSKKISSIGILHGGMEADDSILYVDLLDEVGTVAAEAWRISAVTTKSRAHLFPQCNLITVPDGTEMIEVSNFLFSILARYTKWSEDVMRAIAANQGLKTVVDLTATLLKSPMYISDPSFKMLARWGDEVGEASPTWRYQMKYLYLPHSVTQALIENGELDLLYNTKHAWIARDFKAFPQLPFVSKSIIYKGVHYGNLYIIQFYRRIDECDVEIAEWLGNLLAESTYENRTYLESSSSYQMHFLEEIINGTLSDEQVALDQLEGLGWSRFGDYRMMAFDTRGDNDVVRNHMCGLLVANTDMQCLVHDNILLAVDGNNAKRASNMEQVERVSREFERPVAVSEGFDDFLMAAMYYQQVEFALTRAVESGAAQPGVPIEYVDFHLDHVVRLIEGTVPVSNGVRLLREYDEQHNGELCVTLGTWLANDCNVTRTAEALFVHRNTLFNRIERIREILQVDFDDVGVKTRFLISLHMLSVKRQAPADDGAVAGL